MFGLRQIAVVGEVTLGSESTIWFGAIVRGDVASIEVGSRVNIQDGGVIHGTFGQSKTVLEDRVSIGHNAIVHGAKVCKGALIGMGAVVMDNAVVGEGAVVAAGAVVLKARLFHHEHSMQVYQQEVEEMLERSYRSIYLKLQIDT